MKIAIMQPYLFPYIGYFQLMNAVDEFVIYDNIKYTKKGWINRNRILANNSDEYITLPLKKDFDSLHVKDRVLAETWPEDRKKILNKLTESYRKAPHYKKVYPILENCILYDDVNLFRFIFHSLVKVKEYLEIQTSFSISSIIPINHILKGEQKVIEIVKSRGANVYLNPIGGTELYCKDNFKNEGIELRFLETGDVRYKQFDNDFIPLLSVIDILMFNSKEDTIKLLNLYKLK